MWHYWVQWAYRMKLVELNALFSTENVKAEFELNN